jgi:hypothetical protein
MGTKPHALRCHGWSWRYFAHISTTLWSASHLTPIHPLQGSLPFQLESLAVPLVKPALKSSKSSASLLQAGRDVTSEMLGSCVPSSWTANTT